MKVLAQVFRRGEPILTIKIAGGVLLACMISLIVSQVIANQSSHQAHHRFIEEQKKRGDIALLSSVTESMYVSSGRLSAARAAGDEVSAGRIETRLQMLDQRFSAIPLIVDHPIHSLTLLESELLQNAFAVRSEVQALESGQLKSDVSRIEAGFAAFKSNYDQLAELYRARPLDEIEKSILARTRVQEGLSLLLLFVGCGVLVLAGRVVQNSVAETMAQSTILEERNDEVQKAKAELELSLEELKSQQAELENNRQELQDALDHAENQKAMHNHASRRFQSLFAGLPVGCMTFDGSGTVMEWNPQMSQIFGTQTHLAVLNPLIGSISGIGRELEIHGHLHKVAEEGQQIEFDWEFLKDGEVRTVSMVWFPLKDPNGNAVGGIGCAVDVTTQRQNERRLSEMAALQNAVLNSADYSIISYAPDGTVTGFNRAAERLLGYSHEDVIGKMNVLDFHEPTEIELRSIEIESETGDAVMGVDVLCYEPEGEESEESEWVYCRADGTEYDARLSTSVLKNDEGEVIGYVVVGKDITGEKETRERLRMLSMVAEEAASGVLICDPTSVILYANPAFERLSGWTRDVVYGSTPFDFLFGDDADDVTKNELIRAVRNKETVHVDILQVRNSGEQYWVRTSLNPVYDESGQCKNLVWIQEDVTARKLAEETAALANERTRETLESIQDNFFSTDLEGRFTYVNHTAAELLGQPLDDLAGRDVWSVCIGTDWGPVREQLLRAQESGDKSVGEFLFLGLGRYFEFRFYPSKGGMSVFFQDITDRTTFQRQLEDQNAKLESAKLELEINEKQLRDANERLKSLASTDGLTGLKNHKSFQEFLEQHFDSATIEGGSLAVVLMDVDKFKPYNDNFGHPAGDQVLKGVAKCLNDIVKEPHMVARYGGEEFVMVLTGLDEVEALCVAEEIRYDIEGKTWPHREVTASFGVSFLTPETENRQELIEQADRALYVSKETGRNRVTAWNWVSDSETDSDIERLAS